MSGSQAGWAVVPLAEVAQTQLGKMMSQKAKAGLRPVSYLRNKNVQWGRIDLSDVSKMDFSEEELERFGVRAGDLLVCEGGEVGRAAIWRGPIEEVGFQKALHRVRPFGTIAPEFLLYQFMWLAQANRLAPFITGSTIRHLPQEDLRSIPLLLPPAKEQRRIVAAIEEHFSRLDAADEGLAVALARIRIFRGRVLEATTHGDSAGVPVGAVAEVQGGIQKQPKRRPSKNHFPFLRVANVQRGVLDLSAIHEIELFAGELERLALQSGDLLVVEGNGSPSQIGRSALWRGEIDDCVHQNHLIRVRPGPDLDSDFLNLFWNAPSTADRLASIASSTSGLYTLTTAKVRSLRVPLPPLGEQRRIVAEIEERLSVIDAMRAAIESAQRRSAALRRAILERAFRGELVPQDPSDEPASILLERIRAERTSQPSTSRRGREAGVAWTS